MDAIVFGCGSSGTMTGLSRFFAKAAPHVELVLADPVGSILTQYINEGVLSTKSGSVDGGRHRRRFPAGHLRLHAASRKPMPYRTRKVSWPAANC